MAALRMVGVQYLEAVILTARTLQLHHWQQRGLVCRSIYKAAKRDTGPTQCINIWP
jgi:hypothetical protein